MARAACTTAPAQAVGEKRPVGPQIDTAPTSRPVRVTIGDATQLTPMLDSSRSKATPLVRTKRSSCSNNDSMTMV